MLNLKNNLYFAGVLALCILAACSSDAPSTAGSSTIPNATAHNDSASIANLIVFNTNPIRLKTNVENLEINIYDKENGASASCVVGEQSYYAEIMVKPSKMTLKWIRMENVEDVCDSVVQSFKSLCNKDSSIIAGDGFCSATGDLYAGCADFGRDAKVVCSEGESNCKIVTDSTVVLDTNLILQNFIKESEEICRDLSAGKYENLSSESKYDYWTPGHNPIDYLGSSSSSEPIDTAAFTLDKYEALFAEPEKDYKFDEHVIAYRVLPSSEVSYDTAQFATVKEATPLEVATYFPMTSAIMGDKINPEFCNIYTITIQGVQWPMVSVLTEFQKGAYYLHGSFGFSVIIPSGKCRKSEIEISEVLLVKDCDGAIAEFDPINAEDLIDSSVWTCEENGDPQGRPWNFYGEWYRADIAK
jgi:hypothetical protein